MKIPFKEALKVGYSCIIQILGTITFWSFILVALLGGKIYWISSEGLLVKIAKLLF
ncbi:hypothetical protein [Clostridium tagluense]|uniref:Uncharacterized protein n=1 Tax=Clostridium tagluense TaxID=360422 RepID=A0A401UQF8_9CLOT|nr:hypothetical protein [Clostridium tagluense]GCD11728.1 hypothetical protein Ctaglu_33510 [Clostridium tagluense]